MRHELKCFSSMKLVETTVCHILYSIASLQMLTTALMEPRRTRKLQII